MEVTVTYIKVPSQLLTATDEKNLTDVVNIRNMYAQDVSQMPYQSLNSTFTCG
jgi:hypothetical protein